MSCLHAAKLCRIDPFLAPIRSSDPSRASRSGRSVASPEPFETCRQSLPPVGSHPCRIYVTDTISRLLELSCLLFHLQPISVPLLHRHDNAFRYQTKGYISCQACTVSIEETTERGRC